MRNTARYIKIKGMRKGIEKVKIQFLERKRHTQRERYRDKRDQDTERETKKNK